MLKLGELLIRRGILTQGQLDMALSEHNRTGELLGKALVRLNFISEEQLLTTLAEQLAIPFVPSLRDRGVAAKVPSSDPTVRVNEGEDP